MRMAQEYDGWAYITAPLLALAQLSLFTGLLYVCCCKSNQTDLHDSHPKRVSLKADRMTAQSGLCGRAVGAR